MYFCNVFGKWKKYAGIILACAIVLIGLFIYAHVSGRNQVASLHGKPGKTAILNILQRQTMIATTEVEIKKLGEYNTAKSEKAFSLRDPNTWKWGDRVCIVPVNIILKYGIDLTKLTVDDISIDHKTVTIRLPEPAIVDMEYKDEINQNEIFELTTGLREIIAHEDQETIAEQTFNTVIKDDKLIGTLSEDIRRNTRQVFSSIIMSMGLTPDIQFKKKEL